MVKFQIASDLHIEFRTENKLDPLTYITPSAPYLILTGDIGSLYRYDQLVYFLRELSYHFERIFYVLGNNEFYVRDGYKIKTMSELYDSAYNLENIIPNLIILENKLVTIDGVILIGSTLWSEIIHLPRNYKIKYLSKFEYNSMHSNSKKILLRHLQLINEYNERQKINNLEPLKIIVATHYPPIRELSDQKKLKVDMYSNIMDDFLPYVDIWVYGHVHLNRDINRSKCRIIGNQYGKPGKYCTNYRPDFVIDTNEKNPTSDIISSITGRHTTPKIIESPSQYTSDNSSNSSNFPDTDYKSYRHAVVHSR